MKPEYYCSFNKCDDRKVTFLYCKTDIELGRHFHGSTLIATFAIKMQKEWDTLVKKVQENLVEIDEELAGKGDLYTVLGNTI